MRSVTGIINNLLPTPVMSSLPVRLWPPKFFEPGDRLTQGRLAEDRAWQHLQGTDADAQTRQKVYVTYEDAQAYCNWLNKDLPTEAQFGFAARGDGADKVYNWSSGRKHLTGFRCVTNPTALQRIFE